MSLLVLFGFTSEETESLQRWVKAERWATGKAEDLRMAQPEGAVWVVSVNAATQFLGSGAALPRAVLWVPKGKKPLAFDDWWESFETQLHETSERDCEFLERVGYCAQVLDWNERVDDVPAEWFAGLAGSPEHCPVEELPFDNQAKSHLRTCSHCQAEAYERLCQRADQRLRLGLDCLSTDEVGKWLESMESNQRLEWHARSCERCREAVRRQAWLWEGAKLISAKRVDDKLAAIGLGQAWLTAALVAESAWRQAQTASVAAWGALLALVLSRHAALRLARAGELRQKGAAQVVETEVSLEELQAKLMEDGPMTLSGDGRWLHLAVEGEGAVLLRAGERPANAFERFAVEFRHGEEVVVSVQADDGVARLTLACLQAALAGQADQLVIVV